MAVSGWILTILKPCLALFEIYAILESVDLGNFQDGVGTFAGLSGLRKDFEKKGWNSVETKA